MTTKLHSQSPRTPREAPTRAGSFGEKALVRPLVRLLGLTLAGVLAGEPALADRLVTFDKRILEVKKARKAEGGGYTLQFENGLIDCPERFVASVEIEGDMSDFVPKDDREREMLEKGYVRYRGRWMSKPAFQAELNKEAEARREQVEELALHANFYDGWTKETRHFQFKTNTSPELLEYYADLLESYYALMDKRVGIKPTPSLRRTKMKVNIYKSREEFTELTRMSPGVAGFFSFIEESLNFYHDYEEPEISDWVALHECTHLLTYLIEPQSWPRIWVNEGVADFFGSSDIEVDDKGRISITPGKIQVDRILTVQQAIRDGDFTTLEKMFHIEKSNFGAFEYAHSWSFVYFLNNANKKYEKGFRKFFEKHYTLPKGVEYTWESFPNKQGTAKILTSGEVRRLLLENLKIKDTPESIAKLEQEWLDFIQGIEIDAPLARFKRAYRVIQTYEKEQFDQAQEDLDFAIDAGLEEPRAFWARAMVGVMRGGSMGAAVPDLEKAIELDPLNARFRFSLAQAQGGRGISTAGYRLTVSSSGSSWKLSGSEEDIEPLKEQYGLAMELDPDNEYYRDTFDDFLVAYDAWKADEED